MDNLIMGFLRQSASDNTNEMTKDNLGNDITRAFLDKGPGSVLKKSFELYWTRSPKSNCEKELWTAFDINRSEGEMCGKCAKYDKFHARQALSTCPKCMPNHVQKDMIHTLLGINTSLPSHQS